MQRGKNRLRLAKVIVKNKMSRFYGSVYIYNFIHHQTMTANSENKQTNRNNKELVYINYHRTKSVTTRPIFSSMYVLYVCAYK